MRINVYSQETSPVLLSFSIVLTSEVNYSAVQLMLHSSSMLHHPPADDDRSAVTFWLPKSRERREEFATALEKMADAVRSARGETGLD